jgi:hypothetical protein
LLDLEESGVTFDRYVASFPGDADGSFIVGGKFPASPTDKNHQVE